MSVANPSMSYPKPRGTVQKVFQVLRADSSTAKCVLPKDAVITAVTCFQKVAAGTNAASWTVGWPGATTAILNAFAAGTTSVGMAHPGAAVGVGVYTKLDSDKNIICTFGGTSVSGGTGYVTIEYFIAGAGEDVDD